MSEVYSVLLVDDDAGDRKSARRALRAGQQVGLVKEAGSLAEAMALEASEDIDVVLLDNRLPDGNAVSELPRIQMAFPNAAIVILTGQGDERLAVKALQAGAADYVPKHLVTDDMLTRVLDTAVRLSRMQVQMRAQRAELDLFSRTLAHDLKSPLHTIQMLCDLSVEDGEDLCVDEALQSFEAIDACASRLIELIRSLEIHTSLSRSPVIETYDLTEAARAAVANLAADTSTSALAIEIGPLPRIPCAPSEMIQLLQNLIANALKYATTAALPKVSLSAMQAEGGLWEIRVADNGPGIPEEMRSHIFEPFQRLHDHDDVPGTGLGLATCQKIVARLNGRIWVEDSPGGGATFCFTLPEEDHRASLADPAA
jgi:signal transduction histidine kinase